MTLSEKYNLKNAEQRLDEFFNRKVFEIEPYTLGLAIGMTNEEGLAGIPLGSIIEVVGGPGNGKTCISEHIIKAILNENEANEIVWLGYEYPNFARMQGIVGDAMDRVLPLDYVTKDEDGEEAMKKAEQGLDMVLDIVKEDLGPEGKKVVKVVVIDSLGAMAVSKEIYDDKGNYKESEASTQMAVRAQVYTRWINKWVTLNANTRPILIEINHFKKKLEPVGLAALKNIQIGEHLKPDTLCGKAKDFFADIRMKLDAKPWYLDEGKTKHELYENKIQVGLEIYPEVYRNRFQTGGETGCREFTERFHFETGFEAKAVLQAADYIGIITSSNTHFEVKGVKFRKSEANDWVKKNPDAWKAIKIELAKKENRDRLFKSATKANNSKVKADKAL